MAENKENNQNKILKATSKKDPKMETCSMKPTSQRKPPKPPPKSKD